MKSLASPASIILILLFSIWSISSWFIANNAKHALNDMLLAVNTGETKEFFELDLIKYDEMLHGAYAKLKLIPNSALVGSIAEDKAFILKRDNGPIFINREGVQFGLARWQLRVEYNNPEEADKEKTFIDQMFPNTQAIGSVVLSFFQQAHISADVSELVWSDGSIDQLVVQGDLDLAQSEYVFEVSANGTSYREGEFIFQLPTVMLVSETSKQTNPKDASVGDLTKLNLDIKDGIIEIAGQSKKMPFNLQSRGSIWLNNDTLSSGWQINAASADPTVVQAGSVGRETGYFQADANLQFRELLSKGFWQYLHRQSDIFSLLEQAEWAMEEVETPEQQDFLRSLFLDASRIQKMQSNNPLKPLLIAKRSQIAANANLRLSNDGEPSKLSVRGNASGSSESPELSLKGEAKIKRSMLNNRMLGLLGKWNKKRWFRRYETEFESDITVRNDRFLLNNILVPLNGLVDELSQAVADK